MLVLQTIRTYKTSYILKRLDNYIIITDCQHKFRARRSCETQLVTLAHELAQSMDKGIQNVQQDLIILYFSKALVRFRTNTLTIKVGLLWRSGNNARMDKGFPNRSITAIYSRWRNIREGECSERCASGDGSRATVLSYIYQRSTGVCNI